MERTEESDAATLLDGEGARVPEHPRRQYVPILFSDKKEIQFMLHFCCLLLSTVPHLVYIFGPVLRKLSPAEIQTSTLYTHFKFVKRPLDEMPLTTPNSKSFQGGNIVSEMDISV